MSPPAQNTSLSMSARLLCYLAPPSAILLMFIASPRTALLSPLAFLPTAWFFKKWRDSNNVNPSPRGETEPIIWTYAATATVGLGTVALLQIIICSAVSTAIFGFGETRDDFLKEFMRSTTDGLAAHELTRRAELAASWQDWVFNGAFTFAVAGLVEETLKYLPIAYARRRGTVEQRRRRDRAYIDYALAGALSFGVVETIGFFYAACEHGHETGLKSVLTVFERMGGALGHLLLASLTALRAIRRDYHGEHLSWWAVVGPSVVLHGTFDFVAMAFSALEGNVGWIHPTGLGNTVAMLGLLAGVVSTAAWQVRRNRKALDERDKRRK